MGRPEQKRCGHCRDVYLWWWGSTPYTNDPDNDSTYCPECHKAIRLALEAIPKKRAVKYVETDRFTCLDLDPHTPEPTDLPPKEDREFVAKPFSMMSRRSDLFEYRLETLESQSLADLVEIDDASFLRSIEGTGALTPLDPETPAPEGYFNIHAAPSDRDPADEEIRDAWLFDSGPEDGPWNDLTPEQLASGEFPDPVYPSPEEQEELVKLLLLPIDDEPMGVTTHKPLHGSIGTMSSKPEGTHPPYAPLHMRREYAPVGRREFSTELLPEGTLPMYDKDPDIAPVLPGTISYSVQRDEGGLIDMLDPYNHHKARHVVRDGVTYYYEWWTRTGKAAGKVSIKMDVDAVTGEVIGPWKDYR
jgi:hypothetical protein